MVFSKDLYNWSVHYQVSSDNKFSKKYKLEKINSFLKKNKETILVKDTTTYKRVTIKLYGGGLKVRDEVEGKNIGTKRQFLVRQGQFLFSRIDARNGAFGIATQEIDGAIVTNDFPVFDIDTSKIDSTYFSIVTGSKPFFDYCQSFSSGTTNRQRLDENSFLSIEIPLPPLSVQNQLVTAYQARLQQASEAEQQASQLEKGIESYLLDALGITFETKISKEVDSPYKFLQFVELKDVSRWDIWNVKIQSITSKYSLVKLRKVVEMRSGQFLPQKDQVKGDYIVYGGNGINGYHNKYIYEGKRLVIGRVGEKCGNIHLVEGQYWITDNAFKLDKITKEVTYEYLEIVLGLMNLNQYKILSAQPSLSQGLLLDLEIPLPPLPTQNEIVAHITTQKNEIKRLRAEAQRLREEAKHNFEQEIFN